MSISKSRFLGPCLIVAVGAVSSCTQPVSSVDVERIGPSSTALTAQDRLNTCAHDPRVVAGLVTKEICAGADIFFREAFNGNGRTCGSCHPVAHNFTIDPAFVQSLPGSDPLFVFENDPNLADLETNELRNSAGVRENVDGFEDIANKFVVRGVPHMLSLATSITRDPGDGTASPPVQRTGWSGDGATGDGSLRQFLQGAIKQHYPKTLARRSGIDFRTATAQELDLTLAFSLSLGRLNELDLTQVNVFDPGASAGRLVFLDPLRGRCNVCHTNAGANFQDTKLNRNFNTGIAQVPGFGVGVFDGGFGGQGLRTPNQTSVNPPVLDSFGDGTFNVPPLIEAVDTPPFFHANTFGTTIEGAISFYLTTTFSQSPAGQQMEARFGGPIVLNGDDFVNLARFLRALNGAFNLDIAKQRLLASQTLLNRFHDQRVDIQLKLIQLAEAEIDDALNDLLQAVGADPLYPVAVDRLGLAKNEIASALAASNFGQRGGPLSNAVSRVQNARDQFGANINFLMGPGNLMF